MMNNLDDIKHIDDDDDASDTDSLSSNHEVDDEEIQKNNAGVVYAEVLYQFRAGGPQELSLEKGALVEVMKRETGPWWWGRVKYDAIVNESEAEISQGWFPKDFVKVLPSFGNRKFLQQQSSNDCDINATLPPSSAAPTISSSHSSSEIMRDNVIKELLETEINYVKLLNSLVNG
jgi:Rho guanine nucleotide exchange factor 4